MKYLPVVITAGILLIIGAYVRHSYSVALSDAQAATKQAVANAHSAAIALDDALVFAAAQAATADSARAAADKSAERAARLSARRAPTDSCPKALVIADSTAAAWREAYVNEHSATEALIPALDTTLHAGKALVVATERLDTAATALVKASRPPFFSRLLAGLKPDIGVGAAIGIDPFTRKPSTTIGVTLSWKL